MAWFYVSHPVIPDGSTFMVQANHERDAARRVEKWCGIDGWIAEWRPFYEPRT